jgi:hypothetical protein
MSQMKVRRCNIIAAINAERATFGFGFNQFLP